MSWVFKNYRKTCQVGVTTDPSDNQSRNCR